jgi:glycosyltransferase involved in cell wall biosynthesis
MKILLVSDQFPPLYFGGMATHAYNIARYLGKRHDVMIVILRGQNSSIYKNEPFSVHSVLTKRFQLIDNIILYRIARSFKPDAIHVCTAGMVNSWLSKKYAVITRVVGNDFLRPWYGYNLPLRSTIYRIAGNKTKKKIENYEIKTRKKYIIEYLKLSKCIAANSTWTKKKLVQEGIPENIVTTIVGGYESKIFMPPKHKLSLRKKLGIKNNSKVIITASNLIKEKGIDTVLKAIAECIPNWPKLQYIVVGDGNFHGDLKKMTQRLNLTKNVEFVGRKKHQELCSYYQAADIYVQVSRNETMGRTYIEAGACKLPIIASNIEGVPDVVKNNINGLLISDPENHFEVSNNIKILLNDKKLCDRLGENGMEMAKKKFSWNHVAKAFEEQISAHVLQQVIER